MGGKMSLENLDESLDVVPPENRVDALKTRFETIRVLGSGTTSRVKAVRDTADNGKEYAMKQMQRKDNDNQVLFVREVTILKQISHPNIVKYYNCFLDRKYYFILTEFYTGGHLLKRIKQMDHFTESLAARVMKQLISAVLFLHERNIAHRDIKPENVVFENPREDSKVVLIDLGSAAEVELTEEYSEWVGSPAFMAPETLRPRTGSEVLASDIWSIGVLSYQLLTGKYPFWGTNLHAIFKEIAQKQLTFPDMGLTDEAIAFMRSMLHRGIERRVIARVLIEDKWLSAVGRQFSRPLSHFSENRTIDTTTRSTHSQLEVMFRQQTVTGTFSLDIEDIKETTEHDEMPVFSDGEDDYAEIERMSNPNLIKERSPTPSARSPRTPRSPRGVGSPRSPRTAHSARFGAPLVSRGVSVTISDHAGPEMSKRGSIWPEQIAEEDVLREAYDSLIDEDGQVQLKILQVAMEDYLDREIAFEEAELFLDEIDNETGTISYDEFVRGMNALAGKEIAFESLGIAFILEEIGVEDA